MRILYSSCVDVCLQGFENSSESGARVISQQDLSQEPPWRPRHPMGLDCVIRHWREHGQGADQIRMGCDRGVT
jgi:hypothetical protein